MTITHDVVGSEPRRGLGKLALGLFADGTYGDGWNGVPGTVKGLFYGDPRQFLAVHRQE